MFRPDSEEPKVNESRSLSPGASRGSRWEGKVGGTCRRGSRPPQAEGASKRGGAEGEGFGQLFCSPPPPWVALGSGRRDSLLCCHGVWHAPHAGATPKRAVKGTGS